MARPKYFYKWYEYPIGDADHHSIYKVLLGKPLATRTVYAIIRASAWGTPIKNMSYREFLLELDKPKGGVISVLRQIGARTIDELRDACRHDSREEVSIEYGYA